MKHQLAQALMMERQRLRYEAIGMIRARAIAIRAKGAVLRTWLRTGDLHAVQTAVSVHLSPLIEVVTGGMLAGHLAGIVRTQERVIERGRDRRGIRLSSAYENALRFLRERTGTTQEQQDNLQTRYDVAATQVVVGATRQAQDKIANAVQESIAAGDSVKRGVTKIAEAFENAGLGAQKKHTLEQVFRTQTQLAYSAGRMNSLADPAIQEILWGFEYVTVGDARVRPTHKEMDGHKAPKDDPIWSRWTPPNGYNCRCAILEIFDKGVASEKTPDVQPDKGFAFNPGDLTEGVAEESLPLKPTSTNPAAPDPLKSGSKDEPKDYKRDYELWAGTLTDDERGAIYAWEGDLGTMQDMRLLSAGKTPSDSRVSQIHRDLTSALSKAPNYQGKVYRGLADPAEDFLDKLRQQDAVISLESLSSATKDREQALFFARQKWDMEELKKVDATTKVVMTVKARTGADISGVSSLPEQQEVILRPDAKYRVSKRMITKKGIYEVELEEIDPLIPGEKPTAKQIALAVAVDDTKLEPTKPEDKPQQPGRYTGTINAHQGAEKIQKQAEKLGLASTDLDRIVASMVPDTEVFPTAHVEVSAGRISVRYAFDDGKTYVERNLFKDKGTGRLVIENKAFFLAPDLQGKGYGAKFFAAQVENARSLGVHEIRTEAGGSYLTKKQNGYYTWARLGYDAKIGSAGIPPVELRKLNALSPALADITGESKISELMATPEGRKWWKENGFNFKGTFDLDPQSVSSQVLEAYKVERAARG